MEDTTKAKMKIIASHEGFAQEQPPLFPTDERRLGAIVAMIVIFTVGSAIFIGWPSMKGVDAL